jgi:hypothetical protein
MITIVSDLKSTQKPESKRRPMVCTIRELMAIELAGGVTDDGWIRTRTCGGGVIHQNQIR